MVAFTYRMGAGFAGDVNRTHPASIEPAKADPTNPPANAGVPVLVNPASNGVRGILTTDTAITAVYGVIVRDYPVQQQFSTQPVGGVDFGPQALGSNNALSVLRSGYIMAQIPAGQIVTKGGAVFVWIAASTGAHVLGGFEGASATTNTVALTDATFNGPADANGIVEIAFNI